MAVSTIKDAIEDIKKGRMIILVDDEDRENEGDLCMAAEHITPEAINFMAKHGRGLICLSLDHELADRLELPLMVRDNRSRFGTAFTVSIEARKGVTTGISAAHRATTIQPGACLSDPRPEGRRARQDGPDGRIRGSFKDGRSQAGRRHLRDHEGRRDDGADAGPGGFRKRA
jgi:3,4-dihydroxy 2-butanone 4-phosphate synthase/GTP cyclohydrolase II